MVVKPNCLSAIGSIIFALLTDNFLACKSTTQDNVIQIMFRFKGSATKLVYLGHELQKSLTPPDFIFGPYNMS